jgi:MFS family permease
MKSSKITLGLQNAGITTFAVYASLAAFCAYSCMYTYRKSFAVGTFSELSFGGIDYKIWLITAQVLGYMVSKFMGIRIVAEMTGKNRGRAILILVALAELALLGFAVLPMPYNAICLFFNGLPLGMLWGLVFSYLEGRRTTEFLGAALAGSFIFAAGLVKTTGQLLMQVGGISQFWMPFVLGLIFFLPLSLFVWMLEQIPPPNEQDIELRTQRLPMNAQERRKFTFEFALGIVSLVLGYILLTAFREFRDNFAPEIWQSLGYGKSPQIFAFTETLVTLVILLIISLLFIIKNNFRAFMIYHFLILSGFLMVGISTWIFERQGVSAVGWMTLVGLGLYLSYVPFNNLMFDRWLGAFRYAGNVGFLMYVADSFGYLGSVAVLFYKNFGQPELSWLAFFTYACYFISIGGVFLTLVAIFYFQKKYQRFNLKKE